MCMCGKPTLNGESGYSWDGKGTHVFPIDPPELGDGDELLYDEPGRCGGLDSHSHHLRVVKTKRRGFSLLVRHGGGDERIDLGVCALPPAIAGLAAMDSNARYWLLLSLHDIQRHAAVDATAKCNGYWRKAAAEKRIKTRRLRTHTKVWINE